MPAQRERDLIRAGQADCTCWQQSLRPGFRVKGDVIFYDAQKPQGHFGTCPWVKLVNQVYEKERKSER